MRQSSAEFKYGAASLWSLTMIVTLLFPQPCAFINPFSSFAWLGRERNPAVADSVDNVLKVPWVGMQIFCCSVRALEFSA